MKKIQALLVVIFLFTLFSCSSDDSENNTVTGPKVSTMNEKSYYGGILDSERTYDFNYQNGVLTSVDMGADKVNFVYSGNKIISGSTYHNNVAVSETTLTYNGDLLVEVLDNLQEEKSNFTYASGKLQKITRSYLDNNAWIEVQSDSYTFDSNSNMVQTIITFDFDPGGFKSGYEYDSANNPFKNMNPYIRLIAGFETINIISSNNIIKRYSYSSTTSTTPVLSNNYVIVYNSANYPVSVKKYDAGNELTSEITITYTE